LVYGLQRLNNKSILGEAFKRLSRIDTKSAFSWKEKIENKNVKQKYARIKV
jgi:hypothetical protein